MIINRRTGLAGAASASGATVVIDVFRAFSAAAYALATGAQRIILAAEVTEATALAGAHPGSVLMGEVNGVRPEGFDLGNSPGEIVAEPHLVAGKTVIHRSSAGTRCARAALDNRAQPLYVASLVVATATAAAVAGHDEVTIIASGIGGLEAAAEDEICVDLIASQLMGATADPAAAGDAVASHERAHHLRRATFTHPEDVRLCAMVDRFSFAMQASPQDGVVVVTPTADPHN